MAVQTHFFLLFLLCFDFFDGSGDLLLTSSCLRFGGDGARSAPPSSESSPSSESLSLEVLETSSTMLTAEIKFRHWWVKCPTPPHLRQEPRSLAALVELALQSATTVSSLHSQCDIRLITNLARAIKPWLI